ncbi:hypothetical protein [Mucisphaera calidilacus]|uniref:Uncharacterized protein n=1 Tax=Mucisphaera calidilacus TaxID=2527982 RepID=A0A518BXK2_9BACT|nr:hypothetical protein [Mucisphaera calidilacus]QDU71688.1 hypothetical protein Pan265_15400 [Mucisphaera calidilacus]
MNPIHLTWIIPLFFLSLFGFFAILSAIISRTGGYAPGWRIRCTTCGHHKPAAEAGIIRVAAAGTKYTLGRCSHCRKLRLVAIEKDPDAAAEHPA